MAVLMTLTDRERKVIVNRFGIGDGIPKSLDEVGIMCCVSRERIRQIEAKGLRKMRHPHRVAQLKEIEEVKEWIIAADKQWEKEKEEREKEEHRKYLINRERNERYKKQKEQERLDERERYRQLMAEMDCDVVEEENQDDPYNARDLPAIMQQAELKFTMDEIIHREEEEKK